MKIYQLGAKFTKPRTESCAEKNWEKMSDRYGLQEGCFRKSTVRISKFFSRNHGRNIKYYFPSNVLDGWTFR